MLEVIPNDVTKSLLNILILKETLPMQLHWPQQPRKNPQQKRKMEQCTENMVVSIGNTYAVLKIISQIDTYSDL